MLGGQQCNKRGTEAVRETGNVKGGERHISPISHRRGVAISFPLVFVRIERERDSHIHRAHNGARVESGGDGATEVYAQPMLS